MAACVCAPNIRQLADKKSTLNKKLDQFPLALLLYSFHTTKRASSSAMAIPARNTICYDTNDTYFSRHENSIRRG